MLLRHYLNQLIETHLQGDSRRFDELWIQLPDLPQRLRAFDDDREWLHWRAKPIDGWYCVATEDGFLVYFQEKGQIDGRHRFTSEQAAIRHAIHLAVMPLLPQTEG